MKLKKILPCICSEDKINDGSGTFGMPVLSVYHAFGGGEYTYSIYCPVCGRGDRMETWKSDYYALKSWNELQESFRRPPVLFTDDVTE